MKNVFHVERSPWCSLVVALIGFYVLGAGLLVASWAPGMHLGWALWPQLLASGAAAAAVLAGHFVMEKLVGRTLRAVRMFWLVSPPGTVVVFGAFAALVYALAA